MNDSFTEVCLYYFLLVFGFYVKFDFFGNKCDCIILQRMRRRALERLERNAHVLKSPPKVLIDQCITKASKQPVNEESKKIEPNTRVIESAPKILTERSISKRTPVLDQSVVKTLVINCISSIVPYDN